MSQFQIDPSKEISPGRKILFREGHPPLMGYWFYYDSRLKEHMNEGETVYIYSVRPTAWARGSMHQGDQDWLPYPTECVPNQHRAELILLL